MIVFTSRMHMNMPSQSRNYEQIFSEPFKDFASWGRVNQKTWWNQVAVNLLKLDVSSSEKLILVMMHTSSILK